MKKLVAWSGALALAGCAVPQAANTPVTTAAETARLQQIGSAILFWSQEQRDANFPHMEAVFPGDTAHAGRRVKPLPAGAPLPIDPAVVDAYVAAENVAGILVLQDGKVRLERYARGLTPTGRWTSFSVAKSFTSTLLGAAIRDGYIKSVDEPVTRYIPELAGGGYDGVTIAQLLTMTSGVRWNEDYTDPNSDVAGMYSRPVPAGMDPTVAYMRTLPRESTPGSAWVYKTGETNLVGVLVSRATGKNLARYLEEKIWRPYGMERDAFWMADQSGQDVGGCCLSVSLRDYGRMGQLALDGGKGVVPDWWFREATSAKATVRPGGYGYGFQWWTYPGGLYGAQGIFGQSIAVDPSRKLVVVILSAWPTATGQARSEARAAFLAKVAAAAS